MAVHGRLLIGSGERMDLPDLLSVDSYIAADFKYLIQSFIGSDKPYILKGFDIINPLPQRAISESVSIRVADSIVYYPGSSAGSFYHGLPEGNTYAQPLVPTLRRNAINYIYLTFNTFDTAKDTRAYWDPDQNGGEGGEFSQDVNTQSVLKIDIGVSVSTFPENTIPVCMIETNASVILSIQDCRDLMFRLGTGGISPDPFSTFAFRNVPTVDYARTEPSTIMTAPSDPNAFQGGDKNIYTLKEWMDVVMTRLKEIGGSQYWYDGAATGIHPISVGNVFSDGLASTIKSKGQWEHDATVPGQATWTEDIHQIYLRDQRDVIIRASTIELPINDQVAWIELIREADINSTNEPVVWTKTTNIIDYYWVEASTTKKFSNLKKGDWIKKRSDTSDKYLRVEEFYDGLLVTPLPADAKKILLSGTYTGILGEAIAEYTQGSYVEADVQISSRDTVTVQNAGGNFMWLAYRSDTILGLAGVTAINLAIDVTDADGIRALVTATSTHGLQDGDRIRIITGPYTGEYIIEIKDTTSFFITTTVTGGATGINAYYGIVTTAARTTAYNFDLETAAHGFQSNERVILQDIDANLDGAYDINVRSSITFQIPLSGDFSAVAMDGEKIVLARLSVRTEFGTVKVVQGEITNIGDMDSANILSYIGMESLAQEKPIYIVPSSYNALKGRQNFNCDATDDLTTRISKLTAMMADRVQDRGIKIVGRTNISNTTSGGNQSIVALGNLTLIKPDTQDQVINLTSPFAMPVNSAIVVDMLRDGSAALTPTIVLLASDLLLQENRYILFYRFSTTDVYNWKGDVIAAYGHLNTQLPEDSQNRNVSVFNPGTVRLNAATNVLSFDIHEAVEKTTVTTVAATSIPTSSYFLFSAALDAPRYMVWYKKDGSGTQPVGSETPIMVLITTGQTDIDVADATVAAINTAASINVTASNVNSLITLVNTQSGTATPAEDGTLGTGFTIDVVQSGFLPRIQIIIPGGDNNEIDHITVPSLTVTDGQAVWVRINRFASKVFNTAAYANGADTNGNGKLYVTDISSVPVDQDVLVLWTRVSGNILVTHSIQDPRANIYEEYYDIVASAPGTGELVGPLVPGTIVLLPADTRDNGNGQYYVVGSGMLEIYYNGQMLRLDADWEEVGDQDSLSNRIRLLTTIDLEASLGFRIDSQGAVYFAAGGAGGATSLQEAYDGGRFIAALAGQPVTITGPIGNKLLSIQGDMEVTGIIDPSALQFTPQMTNPMLSSVCGLWVDNSDELFYEDGVLSYNISTVLKGNGAAASVAISLKNGSLSTLSALTPVYVNTSGDVDVIDVSDVSKSFSAIGITRASIISSDFGAIVVNGRITDITTSAVFGDTVYVSKTGTLTNVKPSIGVGSFIGGDYVIRVGVISKNLVNVLNKDLIVNVVVVGQL